MMGIPHVAVTAEPSADNMYVAAHVWDVSADGLTQTLVDRGVYRLGGSGTTVFDMRLNGNAYTFETDHKMKLELTLNDSPTFRESTNTGQAIITSAELTLPQANPVKLVP
jgi:predicted acyl esterase